MALPTITGTARVVEDPELRFAPSGTAVLKVRLVFNSRRKDEQGNWVDDKQFWITGVMFKQAAEKALCRQCPYVRACARWALTNPDLAGEGIYGALTPDERAALTQQQRRRRRTTS